MMVVGKKGRRLLTWPDGGPLHPPIFSGDRNEVQSFIFSVCTSFSLSPSRFPEGDETRRILFALGFIQGGTAGTWANNTANAILDPNTPNPYATFQEFQEAFE